MTTISRHAASPVMRASDRPASALDDLRLPGICLFLIGAGFILVTMLAASIAPAYDFHAAAISDLGTIDETAPIFNVLLVAIGALNVVAGYLLYRSHGQAWLLAIYLIAGVGAAGAGLVPLDVSGLHSWFALLGFVCINLETLATAPQVSGPMRLLAAVAGLAGLVYVVVMVIGDGGNTAVFGPIGHGGSERMIVYPAMLWLMAYGGGLMTTRADPAAG